ncbi:molybdopterin-dependent oxidoreductase [Haloarculaceae archaeon H-GB1-1]|nr:molybdopterin-dependent oxidoreductase [Haloarculaceae archaeon H-GB1-1]
MQSQLTVARLRDRLPEILTALLAGSAGVAGSYAAAGFTPGFVVAPIEGFLARTMPGVVVTFAIQTLGSLGQQLSLLTAIALAVVAFSSLVGIGIVVGARLDSPWVAALLAGALPWGVTTLLTGDPVVALGAGLPPTLVVAVEGIFRSVRGADDADVSPGRRRVVESAVALLGIGGLATAFGSRQQPSAGQSLDDPSTPTPADEAGSEETDQQPTETPSERERLLAEADEKSLDLPGMDPLVSEKFYNVDINAVDPEVNADEWSLTVTGAVEQEVTVDYQELRSMASEDRFNTLRCVGEKLNGHKMDNALWTGVPIQQFVDRAGPKGSCECVMFRAADDYFEEFPLAALEDGFLAYGMNGDVLPKGHGYPVRALVPGHWGEINVKWITEIEILDKEAEGYWEKRGWHGTGPVNTVAKIHSIQHLDDGRIRVGGHTYAGTRGIELVEVSTDGGETWAEATLSEPLPGDDVWRQWMYTYDPPDGEHEVVARATDGTGTLQPKEEANAFPSGPSGWVSTTIKP